MSLTTKRSHEGYLMIDSRFTPGLSQESLRAANLPGIAARGLYETKTYTCSHCTGVVLMNPERVRERAYCTGCDHYLCDRCGGVRAQNGGLCKTFNQVVEEIQEQAVRQQQSGSSIIVTS